LFLRLIIFSVLPLHYFETFTGFNLKDCSQLFNPFELQAIRCAASKRFASCG